MTDYRYRASKALRTTMFALATFYYLKKTLEVMDE